WLAWAAAEILNPARAVGWDRWRPNTATLRTRLRPGLGVVSSHAGSLRRWNLTSRCQRGYWCHSDQNGLQFSSMTHGSRCGDSQDGAKFCPGFPLDPAWKVTTVD